MNQDRIWELLSLKLSGEALPEELTELEQLLKENPAEGFRVETLRAIWQGKSRAIITDKKESYNRHLQRLSNHLSDPVLQYEGTEMADEINGNGVTAGRRPLRKIWIGAAVAASLAAAVFFTFYYTGGSQQAKSAAQNTVSTKRGSKSKVQLPDGTEVWLNADSRITYKDNFRGEIREVELTGEAYFDVVRDESRPFIIHTPAIDVKVLGTAFNIRSYADEENTETSLIRGSVEITLKKSSDKKKIILKPNDKLIVDNAKATAQKESDEKAAIQGMTLKKVNYKKTDSAVVETLWIRNKLAFDEETLEDIALKIERWYDVKVVIADEKLRKEKYTATFEDKTFREVMEALQAGGGFHCTINNKEATIRR